MLILVLDDLLRRLHTTYHVKNLVETQNSNSQFGDQLFTPLKL